MKQFLTSMMMLVLIISGGGTPTILYAQTPAVAIEAVADTQVMPGTTYTVTPTLSSGDTVVWRKEYGPDDVVVDATTGKVTWVIPSSLPHESFYIGLRATDTVGNSDTEVWIVTVGDQDILIVGPGETYTTIHEAFAAASAGDTILIRDGMYEGDGNNLEAQSSPDALPPSGSASGFTTVIAENPSRVEIIGNAVSFNGKWGSFSYVAYKGLFVPDGFWSYQGGDSAPRPHHIKVTHIGSTNGIGISGTDYALVENSYAYGAGRYKFDTYKATNVVFRRNVARFDVSGGQNSPLGGSIAYSSDNVAFQNVIDVDSNQDAFWDYDWEKTGAFAVPTTAGPSNNIIFERAIAVNNHMKLAGYDRTNGLSDATYRDVVGWDMTVSGNIPDLVHGFGGALFDHVTIGDVSGTDDYIAFNGFGNGDDGGGRDEYRNSTFSNIPGSLFFDVEASSYNNTYNVGSFFYAGNSLGTHNQSTYSSHNPRGGSLQYLPRIESGSDLSGTASDGGDRGANVLTFKGRLGTFYGESGWNEETNISMWPFPQEALIQQKMASYNYSGMTPSGSIQTIDADRGFAVAGTALYGGPITLTSYIWEYLGNACPTDICGLATAGSSQGSTPTPEPQPQPEQEQEETPTSSNPDTSEDGDGTQDDGTSGEGSSQTDTQSQESGDTTDTEETQTESESSTETTTTTTTQTTESTTTTSGGGSSTSSPAPTTNTSSGGGGGGGIVSTTGSFSAPSVTTSDTTSDETSVTVTQTTTNKSLEEAEVSSRVATVDLSGPFVMGTRSEKTRRLQEVLAQDKTLYPEGITSGYYGTLTRRAIERFQIRHGIVSSGSPETTGFGHAGPKTRAKLQEIFGNGSTDGMAVATADTTSSVPVADAVKRIDQSIGFGSRSDATTYLQQVLASDPTLYPEGIVSGYYGTLTRRAVERFQVRYGIAFAGTPETTGFGHAGPKTRVKMREVFGDGVVILR